RAGRAARVRGHRAVGGDDAGVDRDGGGALLVGPHGARLLRPPLPRRLSEALPLYFAFAISSASSRARPASSGFSCSSVFRASSSRPIFTYASPRYSRASGKRGRSFSASPYAAIDSG